MFTPYPLTDRGECLAPQSAPTSHKSVIKSIRSCKNNPTAASFATGELGKMRSFFNTRIDFETIRHHASLCDDELDRKIEIRQYFNGRLSPYHVHLDAVGLGVAGSVKLVAPIIDSFVRPRIMLDGDDELSFYFSIDNVCVNRTEIVDLLSEFTRIPDRSALLIDVEGQFAGRTSSMVLLFDRASNKLAREWENSNFDVNLLCNTYSLEHSDEHPVLAEDDADNQDQVIKLPNRRHRLP